MRVEEVKRLSSHSVKVFARGAVGEGGSLHFKMETSERLNDTPKVNDDLIVTITTPAPTHPGQSTIDFCPGRPEGTESGDVE
jgi:hypothetical protein